MVSHLTYHILHSLKKLHRLIFLVTVIGAIVRFSALGHVPVSLYWDEAAMLVDAKAVAETGRDMHGRPWYQVMYPSYGDYKLPVYIWLASASVKLFGVSEWALRLPAAVFGTLEIPLIAVLAYTIIKRVMKKEDETLAQSAAIASSLVMAVSPWSVLFARTGFEGFIGQFFLTASLTVVLRSQLKIKWLCLAVLLGVVAVYSYFSVRYVWPVAFIAGVLVTTFASITKQQFVSVLKKSTVIIVLGITAWSMLLLPLLRSPLYEASQQFRLSAASLLNTDSYVIESNVLRQAAGNTFLSRIFYHRYLLLGKMFLSNVFTHLDPNYLFVLGDDNLRHGTSRNGLFVSVTLIPLFIGILWLYKKSLPMALLLTIWWLSALVPASVPLETPHALRSLNALSPAVIMIGIGWAILVTQLPRRLPSMVIGKGLVAALGSLFIIQSLLFLHDYFSHYPSRSAYDWQDGYRQLSEFLTQKKSAVRTVWVNPDDNRLYLWLMIYGDVPASQFAQLPYQGYQLKEIQNVKFEGYHWASLATLDHKILVVERPGQLQGTPNWQENIVDHSGTVRFVVAEYGR